MRVAYPVIMTPAEEGGYVVYVPDFQINTEGETVAECMYMARDAISLTGLSLQDRGQKLPAPNTHPAEPGQGDIVTLVDVDFDACRARDTRAVRKSVTIPGYLNDLAVKASINFSQVLQEGLKARLGVQ